MSNKYNINIEELEYKLKQYIKNNSNNDDIINILKYFNSIDYFEFNSLSLNDKIYISKHFTIFFDFLYNISLEDNNPSLNTLNEIDYIPTKILYIIDNIEFFHNTNNIRNIIIQNKSILYNIIINRISKINIINTIKKCSNINENFILNAILNVYKNNSYNLKIDSNLFLSNSFFIDIYNNIINDNLDLIQINFNEYFGTLDNDLCNYLFLDRKFIDENKKLEILQNYFIHYYDQQKYQLFLYSIYENTVFKKNNYIDNMFSNNIDYLKDKKISKNQSDSIINYINNNFNSLHIPFFNINILDYSLSDIQKNILILKSIKDSKKRVEDIFNSNQYNENFKYNISKNYKKFVEYCKNNYPNLKDLLNSKNKHNTFYKYYKNIANNNIKLLDIDRDTYNNIDIL